MSSETTVSSKKKTASAPPANGAAEAPGTTVQSIDKVREILFGQVQREYDARFEKLEASLSSHIQDQTARTRELSSQFQERLNELSTIVSREVHTLARRLDDTEAKLGTNLSESVQRLSEQLNELRVNLRREMSEQRRSLEGMIDGLRDEHARDAERLSETKTGREDLADYLLEVAMRLRGDSDLELVRSTVSKACTTEQ